MTQYEKWNLTISALYFLATLFVIIIAVFGERIRQFWNKPRLIIGLEKPALDTIPPYGGKAWFFSIRVMNRRRSIPAQNVQLLLTNVFRKGENGDWHKHRLSGPVQLYWRFPELGKKYLTIGADGLATFGRLPENLNFELDLSRYPNLKKEIEANDPIRLQFKAVSDMGESRPLTVETNWDGQWTDDAAELDTHLMVKEINEKVT